MVYRWRCRHCEHSVWSADSGAMAERGRSHIVKHFRENVREEEFGLAWECPYCDATGRGHDSERSFEDFKNHVFEHVEPLMASGVHVADDVDRVGSVLVEAPLESQGADNARIHFLSPGDICIFVTTNPADRIRLLSEQLDEWPAWTIVITTKERPMAGVDGVDFSSVPLEVVKLHKSLGLSGLGETVSRVLDEQESAEGRISLEFDVLPEIIAKFDLQEVFKFLHVLTSRCERAEALSHYYFDPRTQSESTVNVLDQVFEVQITADGNVFESGA